MADQKLGDTADPTHQPQLNKRPYAAPELLTWGTMRDITLKVGWSGASDGAMKSPNRTN